MVLSPRVSKCVEDFCTGGVWENAGDVFKLS